MRTALLALGLAACTPSAIVVGDIDGQEFSGKTRAYHGISHILIVDEADCVELAWVDDRYYDGINPWANRDFLAIQITERAGGEPSTGVFGFGNDSPIRTFGLHGMGEDFEVHPGREGSVEITEISERGIKGTFDIAFTNSGVAGEFDADFCLNIQ